MERISFRPEKFGAYTWLVYASGFLIGTLNPIYCFFGIIGFVFALNIYNTREDEIKWKNKNKK